MLTSSRADVLRWTLLSALGASMTFSCGGTADDGGSSGDGDGSATGDGDGDPGDGDGTVGDGDVTTGDGDSPGGDGDGGIPECTNPVDLGGGFYSCDEGYTGRGDPAACENKTPRAEPIGDPEICSADAGCCIMDSDCTEPNQFCQYSAGQIQGSWCTAGCLTDSDCGDGQICECADPMGQCVAAQCTSDADCPGEARCASFATNDGCGAWTQYSCQTVDDECASDADCGEGKECNGTGGVRQCVTPQSLCAVGRPFIVDEAIRVAPLCERLDWIDGQKPSLNGLTDDERGLLAAAWEEAAQMEHASIAAFARFSLQLLSLGAPAELIEETNQALADETRHARFCFGLASAYRGRPVGPALLDIGSAMSDNSLEAIVATAIVEGCLGETAAALEAAEAAASCDDPVVREILQLISEEESRHAELAWKFVRWAMSAHPELRPVVESQFGHLLADAQSEMRTVTTGSLEKYGVLDTERRLAIRRAALREVVGPCATHLLQSSDFSSTSPAELRA